MTGWGAPTTLFQARALSRQWRGPLAPLWRSVPMSSVRTRSIALPADPDDATLCSDEVAGPGRPFLLLHGFTGHREDFLSVLPQLARVADAHWIAPDLRGHGDFTKTGRESSFSFDSLVADLVGLLDALEVDRCDLLGHSFGGMLALRFVLTHPDRVASLACMSTAPECPENIANVEFEKAGAIARDRGMAFVQTLVERAARNDPDPGPSDLQTHKWADRYWPHHVRRYGAMDPVAYGRLGTAMAEQLPVVTRLGEIACPTTILVGEHDSDFLPGANLLATGIGHADLVTIPDAGHHPQIENTAAWLDAMRGHLARNAAARAPADTIC